MPHKRNMVTFIFFVVLDLWESYEALRMWPFQSGGYVEGFCCVKTGSSQTRAHTHACSHTHTHTYKVLNGAAIWYTKPLICSRIVGIIIIASAPLVRPWSVWVWQMLDGMEMGGLGNTADHIPVTFRCLLRMEIGGEWSGGRRAGPCLGDSSWAPQTVSQLKLFYQPALRHRQQPTASSLGILKQPSLSPLSIS